MDVISGAVTLIYGVLDLLGQILHFIEKYRLLAFAALVPATLFPILYAKWFPFYKSTLGRALFTKAFGLMLLVDTSVIFFLWPDIDPGVKHVVGLITGVVIVCGMWWQLAAITKIRMADRIVYESSKIDDSNRTRDFEDKHRL